MGDAPVAWETPEGNGLMQSRLASADTEKLIDEQVQRIVQGAYDSCYKMLTENRALLDQLTESLIEKETIDYDELNTMRDAHFGVKARELAAAA